MRKNKLSLIGTSQGGREFELRRMFSSLTGYDHNLEVIFIDQSDDNYVSTIASDFTDLNINIIKSDKCSLSKARNIGLSLCTGNIIGFCDDDAYYNSDFLRKITSIDFTKNTIFTFSVIDFESNNPYGNRTYPNKNKEINYLDLIRMALSVGTFIANFDFPKDKISFSEKLGVGAKFGGSEETELFFRLKSNNFKTQYISGYDVYHDNDKLENSQLPKKYYNYALGYSLVIKTYLKDSRFLLLIEIFRVVIRTILGLMIKRNKKLYWNRLQGLLKGLIINERLF